MFKFILKYEKSAYLTYVCTILMYFINILIHLACIYYVPFPAKVTETINVLFANLNNSIQLTFQNQL